MAFLKSETKAEAAFDKKGIIPAHIAIIMDGNGRWAKNRFMPRVFGHKEGMDTVKRIAKHASSLGVKVLTLYAFSTENWKRPEEEVSFLMKLPIDFFDVFMPELMENNIRVTTIGWNEQLPGNTRKVVENAVEKTKHNTGMILNFALNYGGRAELLEMVKNLAAEVEQGILAAAEVDEAFISSRLQTGFLSELQDPDLLIRTSGEIRLSNFLLWQLAYTELYFTDELWPEFSEKSLERALAEYQLRNRRYGGI